MQNGVNNSSYAGAVALLKDREIAEQVADLYEDNEWIQLFLNKGKMVLTTETSYSTGINSPLNALVDTTGGTVTNNGTTQVTVAFLLATSGVLKERDLCRFPNGAVGWVKTITTSVGVDTVIFKSVNASTLSVTAGQKLSKFSNAFEEGSTLALPDREVPSFIGNKVQIVKHAVEMTDIRKGEKLTIREKGTNKVLGRLNSAQIRGMTLHEAKIAYTMLFGQLSTTNFDDSSPALTYGAKGYGVQTTRGLDPYITAYGIDDSLSSLGTMTITDIEDFTSRLVAARAGKKYGLIGANLPVSRFTNFFKVGGSSGIPSVQMIINGTTINLMCEKVIVNGFEFQCSSVNFLDNADFVDSTTAPAKCLYALPSGKVATVDGGSVDYWRTRYMPIDGFGKGNEQTAEFHYGALSTPSNGTDSVHGIEFQSIIGLEATAPHKFGRLAILS